MRVMGGLVVVALCLMSSASRADVAIAIVGPMTGPYASLGDQVRVGAEQAVVDINAQGGIRGEKIVLEVADDACDPKQAVSVANRLVSRQIRFINGHVCSGSSIPASAVYGESGALMMTPASTNPSLTEDAAAMGVKTVFRIVGRDDAQAVTAATYIASAFAGRRIAIVHDKSAYGRGLADETKRLLNEARIAETMYVPINTGEKDYSALISRLKHQQIDVVYFGGYFTEAGLILRQAQDQGVKFQLVSGDGLASTEFWAIAGTAASGTVITFFPDVSSSPSAASVVSKLRAHGIDPEGYTLYAYAVVQVLSEAIEATGRADDPKSVADLIRSGRAFSTVLGQISFNAKGDRSEAGYALYTWKDGKYIQNP